MKYNLFEEFSAEYPNNISPFHNHQIKKIIYWYLIYNKPNLVKNIKFEKILNDSAKLVIVCMYKGNDENIVIEIIGNNLNFFVSENLKHLLVNQHFADIQVFLKYIFNSIFDENIKHHQQLQQEKIKHVMAEQEQLNNYRSHINSLRDQGLDFIKHNVNAEGSNQQLVVNVLTKEYETFLLNKDKYDFQILVTNLFNWTIKYKNIEFELVMIPYVHPGQSPIINFVRIYHDITFLMKLIEQPYIVKWNPFHTILTLIKNIIQIIKNFENYLITNNQTANIETMTEEGNYSLNILMKTKKYLNSEDINLYDNIILEDKETYNTTITMMIKMIYSYQPNTDKYHIQQQQIKNVNMMYFNRLKDFDINTFDPWLLEIIYDSEYATQDIKKLIESRI